MGASAKVKPYGGGGGSQYLPGPAAALTVSAVLREWFTGENALSGSTDLGVGAIADELEARHREQHDLERSAAATV